MLCPAGDIVGDRDEHHLRTARADTVVCPYKETAGIWLDGGGVCLYIE